jgi:hypothetical protein
MGQRNAQDPAATEGPYPYGTDGKRAGPAAGKTNSEATDGKRAGPAAGKTNSENGIYGKTNSENGIYGKTNSENGIYGKTNSEAADS